MEIKKYGQWLLESLKQPIKEDATPAKSLNKRITFPSGMHSAAKSNIKQVLDPSLAEIQKFLVDNRGKVIQVELFASESKVPNYNREVQPKQKLGVGELSKLRYETIKSYMTTWLNGLKSAGTISQLPQFKETTPIVSGPAWTPPAGATAEQIEALARSKQYTDAQYMEVKLSVIGNATFTPSTEDGTETIKKFKAAGAATSRTAGSAFNQYNRSLFYNYSYAPAAVLGLSKEQAEALPGALLTMNRGVELRTGIPELGISKFSFGITPNGGQTVPVVILNAASKEDSVQEIDDTSVGKAHTAYVADSYNLVIPFTEGTPKWKAAWQFAQWYIKTSFPADWNFIANKPSTIDWSFIDNTLNLTSNDTPKLTGNSAAIQADMWNKFPMAYYAAKVKSFYINTKAEN